MGTIEPELDWTKRRRLGGIVFGALHPQIVAVAGELYIDGHYPQAILEAFKAIENRVKRQSGLNLAGQDLMAHAFRPEDGPIRIGHELGQSGEDEQVGFMFLFMGASRGIRNPKAHEEMAPMSQRRAMEYLSFASLLMRRLDDAATKVISNRGREERRRLAASKGVMTGAIEGILGYPSHGVPELHVYAVSTDPAQQPLLLVTEPGQPGEMVRFRIDDVMPGMYHVVAFRHAYPDLSGGYTRFVLAGLSADAPDDHTLIDVEVRQGTTARDVQVTDWYSKWPLMAEPVTAVPAG
jgi:uncharacterized protein (TIGR02391 family)